jgi:rod shape-determining protein MreD
MIVSLAWLMVFVQSSLIGSITVMGLAPDLLCVLIMLTALRLGPLPAMRVGFLAGFLADCYHPATMGLYAACYTAAGFAGGAVRDRIYREKLSSQIASSAVLSLLIVPLTVMLRSGGGFFPLLVRHGIGSAVYTAALSVVLLPLLNRLLFPEPAVGGR